MSEPPVIKKPELARWLFERNMSIRDGAVFFGTTPETLRRAVLPFGDPGLRPPHAALMRRIIERTACAIRADDWYAPALQAA